MKTRLFILITLINIQFVLSQKNIGVETWSFNNFTFEETLSKMETVNISTLEMYPKQVFSATDKSLTTYKKPKEKLKKMLNKYII
ncbi:hypothetical protein MPF19_11160 [Polaribacter sp. Z014]|uniref:hypothetical protein n=1 Tax=unclassified Polaribacter TaxID=196858 RepID=UPI00193C6D14|nr:MULTISPECIES: hypothetical protein [unclassified Polaribacter]MCL7763978.1 hypothetical protein [Polaribacter sp. Z014]QVY66014.1 hypothetical protein JOP69_01585 [Polaribacter sp. Q13]